MQYKWVVILNNMGPMRVYQIVKLHFLIKT